MISSEKEYLARIRVVMKNRRIAIGFKQKEAAKRSGVNLFTLQRFEQKGDISLENLFRLLHVYNMDRRIISSFEDMSWWSVDELERAETKKKVR